MQEHRVVIVIEPQPSRRTHTLTLRWACPACGKARGEPRAGFIHDGSQRIYVDQWENPCGHQDSYVDVIAEARLNPLEADDIERARTFYRYHGFDTPPHGTGAPTGALALFERSLPHGRRLLSYDTTKAPCERYLIGWEYEGRPMFQVVEATGEGVRLGRALLVRVSEKAKEVLINLDNAEAEVAAMLGVEEVVDAEVSERFGIFGSHEGGQPNRILRSCDGVRILFGDFIVLGKEPAEFVEKVTDDLFGLSEAEMELARRAFDGLPSIIMGEDEAMKALLE